MFVLCLYYQSNILRSSHSRHRRKLSRKRDVSLVATLNGDSALAICDANIVVEDQACLRLRLKIIGYRYIYCCVTFISVCKLWRLPNDS